MLKFIGLFFFMYALLLFIDLRKARNGKWY